MATVSADYYREDQYKDSSNLNARAAIHERFSTNPNGFLEWAFDQIHLQPGDRVLECGCGHGLIWRHNLERIPADCSILLTDLSPGMVAEAQEDLGETAVNFSFQEVNIESLPFDDDTFDVVIADHMLYHVNDRPGALAHVRRVLRPGGRLYAATNGRAHMQELRQLADLLPSEAKPAWRRNLGEDLAFSLENGQAQLEPHFDHVVLHRHDDGLAVTEVEPLIAYMLSSSEARAVATDELLTQARAYFANIIEQEGAFKVTKDVGMFIATIEA